MWLSLLWGGAHEGLGSSAIFRAAPPSESVVLGHIGNFCTVAPSENVVLGHMGNFCTVAPSESVVMGYIGNFCTVAPSESVVLGHIGNFCAVVPTKPWFCGMIGYIQENLCVVPHEIQLGGAQLHRKVCYAPNLDLRERIILDVGTTSGKILYIPQY